MQMGKCRPFVELFIYEVFLFLFWPWGTNKYDWKDQQIIHILVEISTPIVFTLFSKGAKWFCICLAVSFSPLVFVSFLLPVHRLSWMFCSRIVHSLFLLFVLEKEIKKIINWHFNQLYYTGSYNLFSGGRS